MNKTRGEWATFWLLIAWVVMIIALVACLMWGLVA